MRTSLRKELMAFTGLWMVLIIGGCAPVPMIETAPAQKVYQPVNGAKLGNASFAMDYYGKDVETDTVFMLLFPQAARWTPRGYNTTAWVSVQATAGQTLSQIGLVIPKVSGCANELVEAQMNQTIHVWGTVYKARYATVGSVIVVDKCKVEEMKIPVIPGYPTPPR